MFRPQRGERVRMAAEEHNGGGSPSESPTKVEHSFDDLARALAEGSISRRGALKLFAGTALAALIPSRALAQEKVIICHKPGTPDEQTIEVSQRAVASHRGHGDTLGACGETTTTTTTAAPTTTTTSTTSTTTPMCIPNSGTCTADSECCSDI